MWGILRYLLKESWHRPSMHDFSAGVLEAAGSTLKQVRIEALEGEVYHAVAVVGHQEAEKSIDARPSDAIALALRQGCPMYVAQDVAQDVREKWGIDLSAYEKRTPRWGRGLKQILKSWESYLEEVRNPPPPADEKEVTKVYQRVARYVLGGRL